MAQSVLVTGFDPFGGHPVNPSAQIAAALTDREIAGIMVRTGILPVVRALAGERVTQLIERCHPAAVVCFGQGGPRQTALRIERLAANIRDYPIPDNAGYRATGEPVIPGAPAAYFATLPVTAIRDRVRTAGVPCRLSNSAGTFLCNEVFFTALHYLSATVPSTPVGFVHVPLLPEQVAREDRPGPSMGLDTMLRGVRAILEVIVEVVASLSDGRAAPSRQRVGLPTE
ncbi:MAG TPA: pyroglutamyl-peptidase I [bacterium]|nr:pyroglutamyl-peptidase I [bacterium]